MRLKTQFQICILTFGVILALIGSSVALTQLQVTQLNSQEAIARDIQTRATNLNYISNNYFLYQFNSSIGLWQTEFSTLSSSLEQLNSTDSKQQSLVDTLSNDLANLNTVFGGVVSFINSVPRNESVRVLPVFQTQWNRMVVQIQALSFDSQQLSQTIKDQSNQANFESTASIISLMTLFAAFFIAIYFLNFTRTLKSISDLKTGIDFIGSGNLEHEVQAGNKDEIADISKSVNQMSANLRIVTASKTDLEKEIEERKKAEEATARQAELIDLSPDAIIVRKLDGTITFWSKGAEKLYGWTKDEATGKDINVLLKTELPQPLEEITNTLKIEGKWSGEVVHICKDGSKLVVQSYRLGKFGSDDKIFEMLESNVDITQRIQMQFKLEESAVRLEEYANQMEELANQRAAQLKDSERLATIGATAGMVGHDIRNPLQAITGDVFLAKTELIEFPESEEKKNLIESLNEIEKNTDYINKIVQDLQDFARPLNPIRQETNLQVIIDELLEKNGVPKNVKVTVKVEPTVAKIVADSTFINRIMYNLVNNAVQAMPKGGKLTIHAYKEVNDVMIAVKDTGVGIPEEAKSKLFTPLFTTKSKGQGFGLAVIKRMTEALGGTVSFESQEGKGTTFTIRLPLKK